MIHLITLALSFLMQLNINGCNSGIQTRTHEISREKENRITEFLEAQAQNTLGLAIAVIKDGDLVYRNYIGKEDLTGKAVNEETIFPVYSLSKLITATAVFKLIEEDKLSLDDKIGIYLKDLPENWRDIEVKYLLSHSSGIPDYDVMKGEISDSITLPKLFGKKLRFTKGKRWEYNQTNFWLITKIIERVTGQAFENFVVQEQFAGENILFSSNFTDTISNRSFKYDYNSSAENWEKLALNFGKRANSAGGINLTLSQFVNWTQRFDQNEIIKPDTKRKMWTPFQYEQEFYFEDKKDKFLYGWQQYSSNNEISYGYTGGLVTGYRKFINQNMTIIFLANGFKNSPIHNKVINEVAGIIDENLAEK